LSIMLADDGDVVLAAQDQTRGTGTGSAVVRNPSDLISAAGSRYAPVGVAELSPMAQGAIVGKPCEIAGIYALRREGHLARNRPPLLSFFCAGTPSQAATTDLLRSLGADPDDVVGLRYRGQGWPGEFQAWTAHGGHFACSYDDAWGQVLGRRVQWRCKVCVDGTGEHADVSVGDFWQADERGYPVFSESAGNSVVIARTERGRELVLRAVKRGILDLRSVDLDAVARIQPLQAERRFTLMGRLAGRLVTRRKVPLYRGFGFIRRSMRRPRANLRAMVGTVLRTRRNPSASA
jgi:coenzyme F420 hydrogenase subunit beta